jgi:hypothetical protein
MDESVRFATERVPAWVGLSLPGGARDVNSGSQRMELAVVRRSTMVLTVCSGVAVLVVGGASGLVSWAVLLLGARSRALCQSI